MLPRKVQFVHKRCQVLRTDFAVNIKEGVRQADWDTKRDLVRAFIERVEIGRMVSTSFSG